MDNQKLQKEHNEYLIKIEQFKRLNKVAQITLNEAINKNKIKINSLKSRIKTWNSILSKVDRKEDNENSFSQINDILGFRIICLFNSDLHHIHILINQNFEVLEFDDKISEGENLFGYMSHHYLVKLKSNFEGPIYEGIKDLVFEVQVRTITMDAWANISHYLEYKRENDTPKELKKSLNALSALFYLADGQFEEIYQERAKITNKFRKINFESLLESEINMDSVKAYTEKKLPRRVKGKNNILWSSIIKSMIDLGFKTVNDFDMKFNEYIEEKLKDELKTTGQDNFFHDTAIVNFILHKTIFDMVENDDTGKLELDLTDNLKYLLELNIPKKPIRINRKYIPTKSKNK